MKFWRRLKVYLIGFGLGLIIVYVLFGERDLNNWLPQQRVLTAIDSAVITISERAKCQIKCQELPQNFWQEMSQDAKIDFSESETRRSPCPLYRMNSNYRGKKYLLIWEVCQKKKEVELLAISADGQKCDCPS